MSQKILVIDDESDIPILFRQKFRREIQSGELAFQFAEEGAQGLDLLRSDAEISVVFTDLNMPGMDGLTFLRHATDLERPLALVVVSAYGDMINIRTAMNLGAFDFLNKPIDFKDFTLTLNKSLEHVNARRALEIERRKTNFFVSMSHELRTPLNAIIGYSELLRETLDAAELGQASQDAARIGKAGHYLLDLINDLLELSKIENGMMPIFSEPTHLGELLSDVIATIQPLAKARGNQLILAMELKDLAVTVDPTKLRQILINLLANAAKFTENGTIQIIAKPALLGGLPAFQISVRDTGIGINKVQMARLFQPYHQAELDTSKRYGGTGLGLVICKEFCHLMGGDICVESQPGAGSTFTISLPVQPPRS